MTVRSRPLAAGGKDALVHDEQRQTPNSLLADRRELQPSAEQVREGAGKRRALLQLHRLLEELEQTNLREERHPPQRALDELRALGLPDPEAYTPSDLIEIVLRAQRPLL